MKTCEIQDLGSLRELVARAFSVREPILVTDGDDECLVVMRPSVFEDVLIGTERLERAGRRSLRL